MAWSFRRRVKVAPGVHLNLSKSGISTSLGPKGAKMTVGPKGAYVHTSIPGTGLYSRRKISGPDQSPSQEATSTSSGNNDGNIFLGCLFNWPRFLIWVGILGLLIYTSFKVFERTIPGWEVVLFILLAIGGLLLLWRINGGSFQVRIARRRYFDILSLFIIVFGILIAGSASRIHYASEIASDTVIENAVTGGEVINGNVSEDNSAEPEKTRHLSEKELLIAYCIILGVLLVLVPFGFVCKRRCISSTYQVIHRGNGIFINDATIEGLEQLSDIIPDQDERLIEVAFFVVSKQKCDAQEIQRRMGMGYAHVSRVLEQLEMLGIVERKEGALTRTVLVHNEEELERVLFSYKNVREGSLP